MQNQTSSSIPKDIYKEQYSERFADRWDELVNWQGRWEDEGNFFIDLLRSSTTERCQDRPGRRLRHGIPRHHAETAPAST